MDQVKLLALCVIFTILVSFSRDNALFASKAKINVFWNFFEQSGPEGASGVKKKFQKTFILVFEVIVQPPKTHFLTFSKVQKHIMENKSETKIMKITHSVLPVYSSLFSDVIWSGSYSDVSNLRWRRENMNGTPKIKFPQKLAKRKIVYPWVCSI